MSLRSSLINPADSPERQIDKLIEIAEVLMRRVEQDTDISAAAYTHFERAALLEEQVRQRTADLDHVLDLLNQSNSALVAANTQAEASKRLLANAIEAVREGFALFDQDDRLVMWNARLVAHLPDVRAALRVGLPFDAYITALSQSPFLLRPEGQSPEDWVRARRRHHDERHALMNVRIQGDHWLQVSEHSTPDGGTVLLQTDVTTIIRLERRERGKLLDKQARLLRAMLDHLNQGVAIFDCEGCLVAWNDLAGDMLAMPASLLQLGMEIQPLVSQITGAFSSDGFSAGQMMDWVTQTDRPRRPLRFSLRRAGDVTLDVFTREMPDRGFVISITDVSAERRAARRLAEANEELERRVLDRTLELEDALIAEERANASKSRFVAAASHDLLQPISAAKLYMSALAEDTPDRQSRTSAQKALNALSSAEAIIDALLDISRLDSGKVGMQITSVPVAALLAGLRDEFAPTAALKGIDLRVVPSSAVVRSDPRYLRRILQNLVGNAVRYTRTGRVLLGARPRGGSLRFEVWDTGPGIDEPDQERIFNEFERLGAHAPDGQGLGLGLAIVERACAQLGHPLSLQSTPGRGTGFMVSVPRADAPLSANPTALPPRRASPRDLGLLVLLVENDDALRLALCQRIEDWGCNVLAVTSAHDALTLLDTLDILPDAAVLDVHLDDETDGVQLATALRDRAPGLSVTLMSADRGADLRARCQRHGLRLLSKPLDPQALEAVMFATAQTVAT